jgi:hypothetical protein
MSFMPRLPHLTIQVHVTQALEWIFIRHAKQDDDDDEEEEEEGDDDD